MTDKELYSKLVDLYAGDELPEELTDELHQAAFGDTDLSYDMLSMRTVVDALKTSPQPEFSEESFQRILMKMYSQGVDVKVSSPEPSHMQYRLPMTG